MNAQEAAQKVLDKLMDSSILDPKFGVFVKNRNTVQLVRPSTDVFDKLLRERPNDFAGVYNVRASKQIIVSDLIDAGMQP